MAMALRGNQSSPWMIDTADMVPSTDAALLEGLGENRYAAFRARGAALEPADAVAYLRAETERVVANEPVS
jgi:hypothetical protein